MDKTRMVSGVLKNASKLKTKKERVAYLKEHDTPALRDIIRINYDADIVSLLPEGSPPFRKDDAPDGHEYQTLHKAHKGFAYYFKGPYTKMNQMKRESMFVNMLESLHGDEAELVVAAKDKSMNYKGITKLLCKEVWPNLIVK
jgi:hypothetical protein